jgi:hypothetical protein
MLNARSAEPALIFARTVFMAKIKRRPPLLFNPKAAFKAATGAAINVLLGLLSMLATIPLGFRLTAKRQNPLNADADVLALMMKEVVVHE